MSDPLHDALRDAVLSVLLGSSTHNHEIGGNGFTGTVSLPSSFAERIRARAQKGEFDELIDSAIDRITADDLAETLKTVLAEQMLKGLESDTRSWNAPQPGWLQDKAKELVTAAATKALSDDAAMMEVLRARIGMEVDRNRVGITVTLSDPEGK